jgi:hypothetical protein
MKNYGEEYKERLEKGETLDDLLPEAYATVREAASRVLGMEHYRVQIIGGIILHQGRIAEMKTGEGKTLVSTLPAYLNALEGKGVYIVTVNDYLAKRDSEWMGKVHEFDIVEGPMADDTIWNFVNDFLNHNISRSVFWEYAKFKHPTHQISFHSIRALECLEYERSESVNDDTME